MRLYYFGGIRYMITHVVGSIGLDVLIDPRVGYIGDVCVCVCVNDGRAHDIG